MRLPKFVLFRPTTLEETCGLLSEREEETRVVGGGTTIVVDMGHRLLTPKYVISLKSVSEMNYVKYGEQEGLKVGALATISELHTSALIREKYSILSQAAGQVGVPAIRYMDTVGGNL